PTLLGVDPPELDTRFGLKQGRRRSQGPRSLKESVSVHCRRRPATNDCRGRHVMTLGSPEPRELDRQDRSAGPDREILPQERTAVAQRLETLYERTAVAGGANCRA